MKNLQTSIFSGISSQDGTSKVYGDPFDNRLYKLFAAIDAVRKGKRILCGPEATLSQTICINGMQDSVPEIVEFPASIITVDENLFKKERGVYVQGLSDVLKNCYENWVLPGEMGVSWAKTGKEIDLTGYNCFKG